MNWSKWKTWLGMENTEPTQDSKQNVKSIIRDIAITLLIAVVVYFGLRIAVQSYRVDGPSMLPNFETGQWVLVNKLVFKLQEPQRGDVIIFRSPHNPDKNLIKRLIGFPGESIELKDGVVYVHKANGDIVSLIEKYIPDPDTKPFVGATIPEGHYFVLGDNRKVADDSRYGWLVPEKDIFGKAWLSTWPPGDWGLAANRRPGEEIVFNQLSLLNTGVAQ
jgi:signal peptidase I